MFALKEENKQIKKESFEYLPVSGCCTAGSERMRVRAAAASSRAELQGLYVKQKKNKRAAQGFQEKVSM